MVNPEPVEVPPVEVKESAAVVLVDGAIAKMERERDEALANVAHWQAIADERTESLADLVPTLEELRTKRPRDAALARSPRG